MEKLLEDGYVVNAIRRIMLTTENISQIVELVIKIQILLTQKEIKQKKLTCLWQNVENLNIKSDNHLCPIDHSRHPILGILQTKSKWYDSANRWWAVKWKNEWYKEFDNLILYCISEDGKYIERIYIFHIDEVMKRTGIIIYKYAKHVLWYEQYRVKDEKILKHVNDLWIQIIDNR